MSISERVWSRSGGGGESNVLDFLLDDSILFDDLPLFSLFLFE